MSQLKGLASNLGKIVSTGFAEPEEPEEQAPVPVSRQPKKVVTLEKPLPKSKDPEWKGYSLFLRKNTHAEMNFLLRRRDKGEDMSDLVQKLVDKWVAENR